MKTAAQRIRTNLDHVVIAVHDLDLAKRLYSGLGFSITGGGRHPTGTENYVARFGDGYLELITTYDASLSGGVLSGGRGAAEYLKQGEGAMSAALAVTSAEQAAHDLGAAGLKIEGPVHGTIKTAGKEPPPQWWTISFMDRLASRPMFLIEYYRPAGPPEPGNHSNSTSSISALLIAVENLPSSISAYENIGKIGNQEISLPEFGAVGKEVIFERGRIVLMHATDPSGPTARRLKERGEGILAVRMAVTDLDETRKQVGEKNIAKDKQSVLIAPDDAAGLWLEFQAAHF